MPIPHGARSVRSKGPSKITGPEAQLVMALAKAVDSRSFDSSYFAVLLSGLPTELQSQVVQLLTGYCAYLAEMHDKRLWEDEVEEDLLLAGKRITDAVRGR